MWDEGEENAKPEAFYQSEFKDKYQEMQVLQELADLKAREQKLGALRSPEKYLTETKDKFRTFSESPDRTGAGPTTDPSQEELVYAEIQSGEQ